MPCASVSEKPTRVSDAYLNGGLRSVTRPSSSAMARILRGAAREWRQRAAARARFTPAADVADDAPAGEPGEGAENDEERGREPGGAHRGRARKRRPRGGGSQAALSRCGPVAPSETPPAACGEKSRTERTFVLCFAPSGASVAPGMKESTSQRLPTGRR